MKIIIGYVVIYCLLRTALAMLNEEGRSLKDSDEDYDAVGDLIIPEEAQFLHPAFLKRKESIADRERKKLPPKYEDDRSLCYCNYPSEVCGFENETCFKHIEAACYHFAEEIYNSETEDYETRHLYGCAPLSGGSDESHFTCKAHLVAHATPKTIVCCYQGGFCNKNLTVPSFLISEEYARLRQDLSLPFFLVALAVFFLLLSVLSLTFHKTIIEKTKLLKNCKSSMEKTTLPVLDATTEKSPIIIDLSSGSGSGFASLNPRTVAQSLRMVSVIGRGRYGEVKKAVYKGDRFVAVKSFCTKDEESWKNEKEIYQTQMLNHENILQFVAADISSEDSITRLLLVTDYHELGSLYEYLQCEGTLTVCEALQLAYSAASGLEHLHCVVRGTGASIKPAIAHRDVKSKNVIVKRRGVCCVADFGLALSEEMINTDKIINIQVGTRRYMAPEVLNKTLNVKNFCDFKRADIYSFSLVIWEILQRVQESKAMCKDSQCDSGCGSSGSGHKVNRISRNPFLLHSSLPLCSSSQTLSNGIVRRPIQPYEDVTQMDPTLEEMIKVVCEEGKRPEFDALFKNDEILSEVCTKVEECWNANINSRHTVTVVKNCLREAIKKCEKSLTSATVIHNQEGPTLSFGLLSPKATQ